MAIQTTGNLANSLRTRYTQEYLDAAEMARVYDIAAVAVGKFGIEQAAGLGSSVQFNFLSDMTPGVTAISQTADINPQVLRDATATVSPTSRGEALEWSELVEISAYTKYASERMQALGKNQMESVDLLARDVALQGGLVTRAAARASLDAGTVGNRFTDAEVLKATATLKRMKSPPFMGNGRPQWFCIVHPDAYFDLLTGGNIVNIAVYQDKEILFSGEVGAFGDFKIIASPWAKVFGAAGADAGTVIATTLNGSVNALAKQIVVASATGIAGGQTLTIGTEETGNTHYPTNELVRVSDLYVSGTTVDVIGEGSNGGLRFDHASGEAVRNADNVYPALFCGPMSLVKLYEASMDNEYGTVVGPIKNGKLEQFASIGWKFYGNYGRPVESWLLRGEYASSVQA